MEKPKHPLLKWLDGQTVHSFATEKKIPWRALYCHINGDVRHPDAMVMDRISTATGGAVSVQSQVNYFKRMAKYDAAQAKAG